MKADDVVAALHDVGMGELANEVRGALGNQKRAAQAAGKRKRESPGGVQAAQVTGAADVLAPGEAAALG